LDSIVKQQQQSLWKDIKTNVKVSFHLAKSSKSRFTKIYGSKNSSHSLSSPNNLPLSSGSRPAFILNGVQNKNKE
jgi:hypothetical protein